MGDQSELWDAAKREIGERIDHSKHEKVNNCFQNKRYSNALRPRFFNRFPLVKYPRVSCMLLYVAFLPSQTVLLAKSYQLEEILAPIGCAFRKKKQTHLPSLSLRGHFGSSPIILNSVCRNSRSMIVAHV